MRGAGKIAAARGIKVVTAKPKTIMADRNKPSIATPTLRRRAVGNGGFIKL
jgi:hypothetical protein